MAKLLRMLAAAACLFGAEHSSAADPNLEMLDDYQRDVGQLAREPAVRRALNIIEQWEPAAVNVLIELTQIPAPPFGETRRGNRYAQLLLEAGADSVHTDEAGNVIATRHGRGERTVAIAAHLDTVFPEGTDVTVRRDGNVFHAPGVGDDTRGLVVLLSILRALEAAEIETESRLLFIGTVGEEGLGDLRGVRHLFREDGPGIDAWIAIDGGTQQRIINSAVGSNRYRIYFEGPGGHSWGAFGTANPHHALGRAIARFDEAAALITAEGEKATYNVGRIGGGTSVNSVPFEAWMEVDLRSANPDRLAEVDAALHTAIGAALEAENGGRQVGPPLTVRIESVGQRPAGIGKPDTPLVQRAVAAMSLFEILAELESSSTDSNIPIARGIPAITLSRGGKSHRAHSLDESWDSTDAHLGVQIAFLTLLAEAGLADPAR